MKTFVDDIVSKMTLDQKVGQCFTIHWGGSMVTPYVMEAVEKLHIGGIRVTPFGQNSRRGQHYHQSLNYDYNYPLGYKKIKQNLFIPGAAVYVSAEEYAERLNQLQGLGCQAATPGCRCTCRSTRRATLAATSASPASTSSLRPWA